jgi:hypothetical protein
MRLLSGAFFFSFFKRLFHLNFFQSSNCQPCTSETKALGTRSRWTLFSSTTTILLILALLQMEKIATIKSSGRPRIRNRFDIVPPDHLLLDRSPNIGPLISRLEVVKFKNCLNKSFRTFKILTLLYQQF